MQVKVYIFIIHKVNFSVLPIRKRCTFYPLYIYRLLIIQKKEKLIVQSIPLI